MGNFLQIQHRLNDDLELLILAARCERGDDPTLRHVIGRVAPLSWLSRVEEALGRYTECLTELGALQQAAGEAGDLIGQELEGLGAQRQPLPGSKEFEDLAGRVRAIEERRRETEQVLQVANDFLNSGNGQLRDRVIAGMKAASRWMLDIETRQVCTAMTRQLQEISVLIQRDLVGPYHSLEQLAETASRYAGEKLQGPRLAFPAIKIWEKTSTAPPPQIEDAPAPKAAA